MPIFWPPSPYKCLRNKWMVPLEIDEGITDSPDGSLRDAATATDFDPSDSSVPRYVKYFFSKKKRQKKNHVKIKKQEKCTGSISHSYFRIF